MPTDKRLFIAVISTAENIPRDVEVAWTDANVCLEGPYAASTVQDDTIFKFTSAIIDVRYDADVILSLTRKLDVKAVPYLFFVTENLARAVEAIRTLGANRGHRGYCSRASKPRCRTETLNKEYVEVVRTGCVLSSLELC